VLPAEDGRRRRPPAGPALKGVEKLLTTNLTSMDTTERDAGMLLLAFTVPALTQVGTIDEPTPMSRRRTGAFEMALLDRA
jgi:hypothetical protein